MFENFRNISDFSKPSNMFFFQLCSYNYCFKWQNKLQNNQITANQLISFNLYIFYLLSSIFYLPSSIWIQETTSVLEIRVKLFDWLNLITVSDDFIDYKWNINISTKCSMNFVCLYYYRIVFYDCFVLNIAKSYENNVNLRNHNWWSNNRHS